MHAAQRLASNEALQCFHAESKLTHGQRPLSSKAARAEAIELVGLGVVRTIDDAGILALGSLRRLIEGFQVFQ